MAAEMVGNNGRRRRTVLTLLPSASYYFAGFVCSILVKLAKYAQETASLLIVKDIGLFKT